MIDKTEYVEVLDKVLKNMVTHPEDLKISRSLDEMGVLLRVKANPQDMGLIIGRNGELIKALKMVMKAIGLKSHARINIKLEEPSALSRAKVDGEKIIEDLKNN
ncbi:MAG: KH domain-containing protein [Patescibacteria group bacterium]|nr:KH domain-containing protein [Patescibacteria group bacterium]MCL5258024.1 KH domain-containing protein [Patescibacteria group bacterium]